MTPPLPPRAKCEACGRRGIWGDIGPAAVGVAFIFLIDGRGLVGWFLAFTAVIVVYAMACVAWGLREAIKADLDVWRRDGPR